MEQYFCNGCRPCINIGKFMQGSYNSNIERINTLKIPD